MLLGFNTFLFIFLRFVKTGVISLKFIVNIIDIYKSNGVNFFIYITLISLNLWL